MRRMPIIGCHRVLEVGEVGLGGRAIIARCVEDVIRVLEGL